MNGWHAIEGSPYPLGVSIIPEENAYNFALYSTDATGLILNLYSVQDSANPVYTYQFNYLKNKSGRVWHCRLPATIVQKAKYYGYQVEGPFNPDQGHRFDPEKILLDPYARAVYFPPEFSRDTARQPGCNAGKAPLGIILPNSVAFDWGGDRRPRHTHDTVTYELHVRGFTRRPNSGVDERSRGTFAGLGQKIPYLKELGVTVVEIMPVFQFDPQEGNYWGYMPLSLFALHHLYAASHDLGAEINEFRAMVKALHQADIEVILDVVYNHTTEDDEYGPTYSFRGIDNSSYYLLAQDRRRYINDSGTGNVLNTANRHVRAMVLDSLRYWVKEMHIDGFRFDLASLFTRNSDGSIDYEAPPIIAAIRTDPELADCRLIAEAWDISSYQVGRAFPGVSWMQWNGCFRDDVRRFVRGDRGMVGQLMLRLYGSDDLFPDSLKEARHAFQSVNYITSHDGFSLYDLVSYNTKHNEANGLGNTDGMDENFSWNCGQEGDENLLPAVFALRKRQVKNFCCLLMLANGTPMFCAGDEFMKTQGGNNNPYNQDNEITWLDWDLVEQNRDIFRFFKLMIAFRKAHPSLGRSRFWREDVSWYGTGPDVDLSESSRSLALCLHGGTEHDQGIYIMINAFETDLGFIVQEGSARHWRRVVDTSLESPDDILEPGKEMSLASLSYPVRGHSVVVLVREG
jgi:glycogen operon protein